ncbi:hypothetical protein DKX38_014697 [Salix brachista]|uniref:Uncharacterized protein n=1 Tax=Salix brachista TaxID=2182728 RepID=A0A5N5LG53_9ROSI|nr:hypothetical protein DKX38_014697 [Salix brachista]
MTSHVENQQAGWECRKWKIFFSFATIPDFMVKEMGIYASHLPQEMPLHAPLLELRHGKDDPFEASNISFCKTKNNSVFVLELWGYVIRKMSKKDIFNWHTSWPTPPLSQDLCPLITKEEDVEWSSKNRSLYWFVYAGFENIKTCLTLDPIDAKTA